MSEAIEIRAGFHPRAPASDVVFDWDGTLSFFRAGWGEVMLELFLEHLPPLPATDPAVHRQFAQDEIWRLNGRPSIHQMQCLADHVAARGGAARPAVEYLNHYAQSLHRMIGQRVSDVHEHRQPAEAFMPLGARRLLAELRGRGVRLHVVSGTEQQYVAAEAGTLGVAQFFDGRIHGPQHADDRDFSKRRQMDAVLADYSITAAGMATFGDGQVEVDEAHRMGATAIAVATDETSFGSGRIDPAKRERLNRVGADAVIPDYADLHGVLRLLGHDA